MAKDKPLRRKQPTRFDAKALHTKIDGILDDSKQRHVAALWYVENGFYVVPFRQQGHRGFPRGMSQHDSTISAKVVDKWWDPEVGVYLDCDIAFSMGGASGYVALDLDVDAEEGKDGIQTFADLLSCSYSDEEEALTVTQETPRGGRHLLYQFHPEIPNDAGFAFSDVDTRGAKKGFPAQDGGVIFVEPTTKYDKDGVKIGRYRWQEDEAQIKDVPAWLVDLLNGRTPGKLKMPDIIHTGERDVVIYKYLMSCAGMGYTADQLEATGAELLKRMELPDENMVRKKVQSVMGSQVYESAQKEKHEKAIGAAISLKLNDKGQPLKTTDNLLTILESTHFQHEMKITYDEFYKKLAKDGKMMEKSDFLVLDVMRWLSRVFGLEYGKEMVRDAIESVAYTTLRTNALADYINQAQPQIKEYGYFDEVCEILGIQDNEDARAYLRIWLCGAVARGLKPGTKFDHMLILVGAQGIGKSMFLNKLCPNEAWFCDSITSNIATGINKKDELAKLQQKWIVEMGEMTPFKNRAGRSGDDEIKAFITATHDEYRGAYGREEDAAKNARTCVLAGTTNRGDFLRDITGSRRFIVITLGDHRIDWNRIPQLRDGLWAEMRDYYAEHGSNALVVNADLERRQTDANQDNYYMSDESAELADFIGNRTRFTAGMIMEELKRRNNPLTSMRLNEVAAKLREALIGPEWRNSEKSDLSITLFTGDIVRKKKVWVNSDNLYEQQLKSGSKHGIPYLGELAEAKKP